MMAPFSFTDTNKVPMMEQMMMPPPHTRNGNMQRPVRWWSSFGNALGKRETRNDGPDGGLEPVGTHASHVADLNVPHVVGNDSRVAVVVLVLSLATFPTRSAPTSAALVKTPPPPTRAKRAIEEAVTETHHGRNDRWVEENGDTNSEANGTQGNNGQAGP